jgi:ribosomal protein L37AE/L43A
MSRMGSVNRLASEVYKCDACERVYADQDVRDTWKCPECGKYIYIYGEDKETNTKIVLIRKRARRRLVIANDPRHPAQLD